MADIEDDDLPCDVVDAVAHAVLPTSSSPQPFEGGSKLRSYSVWPLREGADDELTGSTRGSLG
jgi:hypothetical protein